MTQITLNDASFALQSYSRNTNFNGDNIDSSGYLYLTMNSNDTAALYNVAKSMINTITIQDESNNIIYSIENAQARILNINESYNGGDNTVTTSVNLHFTIE